MSVRTVKYMDGKTREGVAIAIIEILQPLSITVSVLRWIVINGGVHSCFAYSHGKFLFSRL